MKIGLFIICFYSYITVVCQNNIYYDISLKGKSQSEAFGFYSNRIAEILSYKLETTRYLKKRLLKETIETKSDTVNFVATYWCQENGVILPYMFGSSLGRETLAHKELKEILSRFRVSAEDMKKLTRLPNGDQAIVYFNYRKITDSITQKTHFEHFQYDNKPKSLPEYSNDMPPIFKGCKLSRKKDLKATKNQLKIKDCMSKKIDRLILNNFNSKDLVKHPFINGRQITILNSFIFDKQGLIKNIKSVSIRPELEDEASRVFSKIPTVSPALVDGKPVNIIYQKSITFLAN